MAKKYRIHTLSTGWKLPFNIALLFHILLLSSAIILPKYIKTRPKLPEFTSVDLINIADILPPQETAAPQPSTPPKAVKPPPVKIEKSKVLKPTKTAPIAPVIEEAPQPVAKPISIKPLKRKLKKKVSPNKTAQDIQKKKQAEERRKLLARQQALEARSRQLQEEANRQKAIADAEAKIAASEALNALKQSLRADSARDTTRSENNVNRRSGRSSSVLEAQYFSSIFSHLHQYWSLPEIKQWDPKLTAIIVIQIAQNGRITNHSFEKRSGDKVFDQFVDRTIREANPLPAIPGALKEQHYTIGLRFKPGKIQ